MNGFLLINKPTGKTSYDIIRKLKTILPPKSKIGHSGTLDPFATGLLIIAIGRQFTKQLNTLLNLDKVYTAEITLGIKTDSYDIDGKETYKHPNPISIDKPTISNILEKFKGTIDQMPPIYSAKKVDGVSAHKRARRGETVELKPSTVDIYDIKLNDYNMEKGIINIEVHCSKGTYIRSLAHDIGEALDVGGYLSKLCRLSIGEISLSKSITVNEINSNTIADRLLLKLPGNK